MALNKFDKIDFKAKLCNILYLQKVRMKQKHEDEQFDLLAGNNIDVAFIDHCHHTGYHFL